MKTISLIADTGIQFIELKVDLSEGCDALKVKHQAAFLKDEGDERFAIPVYDDEKDCFVNKFDPSEIIEDNQVYTMRAQQALGCFEGEWLPFPVFTENHNATQKKYDNGPFGWCRIWIGRLPTNEKFTHSVILAFDTKYDSSGRINKTAHLSLAGSDNQNCTFSFTDELVELDEFLGEPWVDTVLKNVATKGAKLVGIKKSNFEDNELYHIGLYLPFLEMINVSNVIPDISVYFPSSEKQHGEKNIEVDLILDIGNSRSCGLVLETSQTESNHSFSFAKASILKIRNMQQPSITYDEAFEMRCEFITAEFGDITIPEWENCFEWPSAVRVGAEAVNRSITAGNSGVTTGMSSPKRYLWDQDERENSWHYNLGKVSGKPQIVDSKSFLSTVPVDVNGKLSSETYMKAKYSRNSLMVFALVEIILQAVTYVNSYGFRVKRGNEKVKRVLNRVVLTAPTAMLNTDKKTFRKSAYHAIKILQEYYGIDNSMFADLTALPSAQDVITNPEAFESMDQLAKKDWGYDEATCAQLSFMYGEITSRYQYNAKLFFEMEGKQREIDKDKFEALGNTNEFHFNEHDNAISIASLDIGGGTTDLMICTYREDTSASSTEITPFPEFYEGFNLAGDDVLKRVIERLVIPIIRKSSAAAGCYDSVRAMHFLFGEDTGEHSVSDIEYRKLFASQVAFPIAVYALDYAKKGSETKSKNYNGIISELGNIDFAKQDIFDYINRYINSRGGKQFNFLDIDFIFDVDEINDVVTQVVQPMLLNLSSIIAQFDCDYLLLAGRPTTLPVIKDIINKYMPVTPDKVIALGNYRIGKWYPFAKSDGVIDDPKTTVAVGAAIALMAGSLNRLNGFRLNTLFLKNNVKSTAKYIGELDIRNKTIVNVWFKDDDDEYEVKFSGSMFIGMKQMDDKDWLSTPMYKMIYKDDETARSLIHKLPLKVTLGRCPTNPEMIGGVRGAPGYPKKIEDKHGNHLANDSLLIKPQTLVNEDGHWVDTGVFHLSREMEI